MHIIDMKICLWDRQWVAKTDIKVLLLYDLIDINKSS